MEKTIDQITELLKNDDISPPDLAALYTQLAGWYSYYGQMMKKIKLEKPHLWMGIKYKYSLTVVTEGKEVQAPKPLSDKAAEMEWEASEEGQKEIALKYEMSRIEQMMKAIKSRLYIDSEAARNQY